jgi:antitoxin component of MazEF toxin-antitoxin module
MGKNARADESVLHLATSKGGSLRTTIPAFIVSTFELKEGEKIRWKLENGKIIVEPQQSQEQ